MTTTRRLVLASGLLLFLELALIRWLGSNILHLSYFTNFVLLGSFLGIGVGFMLSSTRLTMVSWSPVVLAVLTAIVLVAPVGVDRSSTEIIYFTSLSTGGPPAWLILPVIFVAVAAIMAGPAEAAGRCFADLPPLVAYRLDLLGSLAGIATFTALSFLRAPSLVWGAIAAIAIVTLIGWPVPLRSAAACATLVGLLTLESMTSGVSWSPYYKVTTKDLSSAQDGSFVEISVNGLPHQVMRTSDDRLSAEPQYRIPYVRLPDVPLDRVLIVGAGSGSDVAIALARGARHVDAVEIDPRILQIGREGHPDQPYQSPRVDSHVNDGRAFLEQSDEQYDLILFALPDSLALVTGASAIRLESYLFTREAIEAAHERLSPGGGFAMYNYYREDRLIDRLAGTVADVFGHDPCVDRVGRSGGQAVIAAAVSDLGQQCSADLSALPTERAAPATDERPFPYFFGSSMPTIYLLAIGAILLLSLVTVRTLAGPFRRMSPYRDFFFMGAAFLLMETKSVTTFALLFGTTWVVNAIVFAGVLVAVLLAVETTRRLPTPRLPVVYGGVAISLTAAFAVPDTLLLNLSLWPRLMAALLVAFTPIYLANVAFAQRFAATSDSRTAFAVNILGAMVGGCLEYFALIVGYRQLLVLAGALYLVAFVSTPRTRVLSR